MKSMRFHLPYPFIFMLLLTLTFTSTLVKAADSDPFRDRLTGDWGGWRTKMEDAGAVFNLNYTAEPARSISGGYEEDSTYLHNINAELKLNLDKLIGFPKTTFLVKYSSRSGDNLSEDHVAPGYAENGRYAYGEYFNKSQEAYGGQTTKVVNFQLTTQVTDDMSVDYGRLVMNDLFLRSDLYCNFMNNAICGSPKGVFTPYALNAYPDATLGIHAQYTANEMLDLKLGVFDGGWTKQYKDGWDWQMGRNGAAYTGEIQLFFDRAPKGGAQRVLKFGANYHSGDFTNLKTGNESKGQTSLYMLADWWLTHEAIDPTQGLSIFGSVVHNTDKKIAALTNSFTLGTVYQGIIPDRNRDKLGFMVTYAEHSKYNTYTDDYVSDKKRDSETVFELTYNFVFDYGIQIMPSVQYIVNPNGSRDLDDATVVGLKCSVSI